MAESEKITEQEELVQFVMTFHREAKKDAPELIPATTSIPNLLSAVHEMDRGARAYAGPSIAKDKSLPIMALTEIRKGSLELVYESSPHFAVHAQAFAQDIADQNWNAMPLEAFNAVTNLYKTKLRLGAELKIKSIWADATLITTIAVDAEMPKRTVGMLQGTTTLAGQVIQTGGASPAIDFRIDSSRKIIHGIAVDELTARKLGERLYTPVLLRGIATWNTQTWEIQSFKFEGVIESKYTGAVAGLAMLQELSRGVWDDVNIDQFIAEVRGDSN